MKSKTIKLIAIGACALLAAAAGVVSFEAHAWSNFTSGGSPTKQVFCDMPEIRGDFLTKESRYLSLGTCVELQGRTPFVNDEVRGRSEFDDYREGKDVFRVDWTAEGGYDLATREAWEKIALAPTIDQRTAAGRPYGRFESKMVCGADPWLESATRCTLISRTATGSLGDMEEYLRKGSRPFTSYMKSAQSQALYDSHQAFLKRLAAMAPKASTQAKEALRSITLPEILEPRAGSVHPPGTPMKIRVAAPRNLKIESYELEIEYKKDGTWQVQTNVPVTATEVESPLGYKGWGWHEKGTGTQMTAEAGTYRLRARTMRPGQGEYGEYREFTIAGAAGVGPDAVPKSNVLSGLGHAGVTSGAPPSALTRMTNPPSATPQPATTLTKAPLQKAASSLEVIGRPATLDWNKVAPVDRAPQTTMRTQP
jgi:hypothetical protein